MFDSNSRYAKLDMKTLSVPDPDGEGEPRQVRYVERRFLPPLDASVAVLEHAVVEGDRLDNVTAKYLGDPTQFWRVADANPQMRPEELTDEPGSRVVIALPRQ